MGNDDIEAARTYHEITKHSYASVRSGAYLLDWDNKPAPYKIYPDAGSMALPRELDLPTMPTLEAIAAPTDGTGVLDIENLTRILFCADGLTRRARVGGEDYHFRAAASAGALYPIETYVVATDIEGIEPGLYHFSPADLKLRGLRRGDWREAIVRATAIRPSIANARVVLIMSAIVWRSAWKYRARAYRYCFWDAGTILANLLAAAAAEGISAEVVTAFVDSEIETLIGVDADREGAICLVALGSTTKQSSPSPEMTVLGLKSIELSKEEVVYQPIVKMQRESRLESLDEVRRFANVSLATATSSPAGERLRLDAIDPADAAGLGETILRRGSTRAFTHEEIGGDELTTILSSSGTPIAVDFPRLTDAYLIVNAVEGLALGAYYFERESKSFELLKAGDFRNQAGYLCLEQPLGRDCSALIVYMANLERALETLGNRGYRDAHLEAGILAGMAYLASYAMDRGATGLTFYDDDTTRFFEPHGAGKSPLLMVAVGIPLSKVKTE